MPAPTVAVTVKLSDIIGVAIEGATVRAKLDRYEVYQQFVAADDVTGTTDADGECVLNLFPNALPTNNPAGLGSQGSVYHVTATGTGGKKLNVQAVIPNQACDLHDVIVAEGPGAPSTGEIVGAVRYNIAQTLTSPQQAQARANIGFDAAVRAVALTGLSLATATAVTAADTVLVALGKAQAQITALDAAKANLSGAAFSGAVSATGFTGPLTGNVTGNASTATVLATARNINGVAFNGSADITVAAAAGTLTGTTLAANVVNASISSITPSGGTLSINGSAIVNNRLETQGFQGAFFGNAGGVYTTWGTASPVGDIGTGNVIIGGGSASDFALNVRGANILHLCSGDVSRVAVNASGVAVTGSMSATNSTGRIDANDSRAAGVGVGGSLFLRGKDDNNDYQDFAGINAFLTDGTVGAVGAGLIFKTRLSGTFAERMRLLSSGDLLINQTTNPNSYKLAVTGDAGFTGSFIRHTSGSSDGYFGAGPALVSGAAAGTMAVRSDNGDLLFSLAATEKARISSTGLSVTGLTTTDTLRVNVTPTAETPTATHTAVFNINGTNYKFLCLVA